MRSKDEDRIYRNPDWEDGYLHNTYDVSIRKGRNWMRVKFWDSAYNTDAGEKPSEYDILACLAKYDVGTLEDFVDEYGYDINSVQDFRRCERMHKAVVKEYRGLCRIFTEEELEELREIW